MLKIAFSLLKEYGMLSRQNFKECSYISFCYILVNFCHNSEVYVVSENEVR